MAGLNPAGTYEQFKKTYVRNLSSLRNKLSDANTALLSRRTNKTTTSKSHSTEEMLLLSTLESLVPSAAASYRQALDDLLSSEKVSFKGTSAELREAFREVIDKLAPDEEVAKQDGFKLEDGRSKPTQKQKVRFILKARKEKSARMTAAEKATQVVEEFTGEFARAVYDSASLSTHTQAAREDIIKLKRYINAVLFDILQISEPS